MAVPKITDEQVKILIPQASEVKELDKGGQKIVFTGIIEGQIYALKFMSQDASPKDGHNLELPDDVTARAQREVETMQQCSSPHLVRMGPIGLACACAKIDSETIVFFSEEFIDGKNLLDHLRETGPLPIEELIRIAFHVSEAINAIWAFQKIHRDIKPGNIMLREANGEFVLLDMGFVFDLQDVSLSVSPVGTQIYFSPEQTDFSNRRTGMDFRSDLFSLGIVLYEMATGRHPFITESTKSREQVVSNIVNITPMPPISFRPNLPKNLNDIILRLLAKRPPLRFRSIERFQKALSEVNSEGEST